MTKALPALQFHNFNIFHYPYHKAVWIDEKRLIYLTSLFTEFSLETQWAPSVTSIGAKTRFFSFGFQVYQWLANKICITEVKKCRTEKPLFYFWVSIYRQKSIWSFLKHSFGFFFVKEIFLKKLLWTVTPLVLQNAEMSK